MGNSLVVLTLPDELFGFSTPYLRAPTGELVPLVSDRAERRRIMRERAADLVFMVPVKHADRWHMPEEPWREHGMDWHWDPALLDAHREKVRASLESFLNKGLHRLDEMARSGWFIVRRARCAVTLRERPHGPSEKRPKKRSVVAGSKKGRAVTAKQKKRRVEKKTGPQGSTGER